MKLASLTGGLHWVWQKLLRCCQSAPTTLWLFPATLYRARLVRREAWWLSSEGNPTEVVQKPSLVWLINTGLWLIGFTWRTIPSRSRAMKGPPNIHVEPLQQLSNCAHPTNGLCMWRPPSNESTTLTKSLVCLKLAEQLSWF